MHSMVVVLIFSPFCIPICMLIRCQQQRIKKSSSALLVRWLLLLVDVWDLCNVVTAQTIIFLAICVVLHRNEIHMHKQSDNSSCQIAQYQCRAECKNPYTRAPPFSIETQAPDFWLSYRPNEKRKNQMKWNETKRNKTWPEGENFL